MDEAWGYSEAQVDESDEMSGWTFAEVVGRSLRAYA